MDDHSLRDEANTDCFAFDVPGNHTLVSRTKRASGVYGTSLKRFVCLSRVREGAHLVSTDRVGERLCL
jgi:hypothetical protein